MSAPTPAPGDDRPREGYYPDPSIPGYVRYWNGASWVPGTSRPAPQDGEPLTPPPGVRPVTPAPAVEETGPHFFDEDPQPAPTGQQQGQRDGAGGAQGRAGAGDGRTPWGADPRIPAAGQGGPGGRTDAASNPPAQDDGPDPGGTFIFRRPVPGPAAVRDEGTMTFRPVPGQGRPGDRPAAAPDAGAGSGFGPQTPGPQTPGPQAPGPQTSGPGAPAAGRPGTGFVPGQAGPGAGTANSAGAPGGFGPQGPVGRATPPDAAPSPAAGPGFGAGKAAAARAAAAQPPQPPQAAQQAQAPAAVAPSVPAQGGAPAGGPGTPLTSGPGGGQASWAQQVHQLAGGGDEQPMTPWKPPVEDVFQAAARRQAAARPAGVGKRLAARLIDTLIVLGVTATAAVPLGLRAADHVQQKIDAARLSGREVTVWLLDGTTATSLGIVLAVLLLAGVAYEVVPTAKWGRTLGKRALGLEVRDIEAHEPPTFGPALRRWLVYSIPGLLGIGIVGVLWCLFDRPWHQCWHDKAAHTFVAG